MVALLISEFPGQSGYIYSISLYSRSIDLRIDYPRGAEALDLIVESNLVHLGNRIMVTSMQAFQEGQLVTEGKAVYNFIKSKS